MADMEKVIKGLERCRRCDCDDCAEENASHCPWDCVAYDGLVGKAIALLKEQEEEIRHLRLALDIMKGKGIVVSEVDG